jgi:hypothetical protein
VPATGDLLDDARRDVGLSHGDLWFRYFEIGGMQSALEVEAYLYGALAPTDHDHDLIAVVLNERYSELGQNHPIAYSDDPEADLPTVP